MQRFVLLRTCSRAGGGVVGSDGRGHAFDLRSASVPGPGRAGTGVLSFASPVAGCFFVLSWSIPVDSP